MSRSTVPIFALLLLTLLSTEAYAQRDRDTWTTVQPIEVSGHVRRSDLGEPARNVLVRLERFSGGVVEQMYTDDMGRFRFGGLQRGSYVVIVESPGFQVCRQTADLLVVFKAFLVCELHKEAGSRTSPAVLDLRVPAPARDQYAKAVAALEEKNVKLAIPHLEKAVSIHREFFDAYLLLGTSLMDLRQWKEAEVALRQAVKIKEDSSAAVILLGEVNWRLKRYDEAESLLQQGLKLDEKNWQGYFTLARLYWEKGDVIKAGTNVGRSLQLKPDFAEAHLLAGNILLRINQRERALVEYREYLRLAPKGEFALQVQELVRKVEKSLSEKN